MKIYVLYSATQLYHPIKVVDEDSKIIEEYLVKVDSIQSTVEDIISKYEIKEIIGW